MLRRFWSEESGSFATTFAVALAPMMIAAGMTVDYTRQSGGKVRLQDVTDSAALAGVRSGLTDTAALATLVRNTMDSQITSADGITLGTVNVALSEDGTVTVDSSGTTKTWMLGMIGKSSLAISAHATAVTGANSNLEMALVLDTTGSMAASDKLTTLKSSATSLVNTLSGGGKNPVKIALVPFAQYVNVGVSNRGASWLTRSDDYSTTTTTDVAAACTTKKDVISQSCALQDATSVNDGVTTYYKKNVCNTTYGPAYQVCTPATTKTTTTNYKWTGCVGSRNQPYNLTDDTPSKPYPALYNQSCATSLIPLTNDFTKLKTAISGLTASGETYAPAGLVWGLNTLSPDAPFTEAAAYDPDRQKPRKTIVFMTDGVNTKSMPNATSTTHTGSSRTDADTATKALCKTIKDRGIEIFTVALLVDDAAAKTMLQDCATDASHYFDASAVGDLTKAFQQIVLTFSLPHLVK